MKKGICYGSLPGNWSDEEKFRLVKRAGYDGIEINTLDTPEDRKRFAALARDNGLELHGVMASGHWQHPLSSADEATRQAGLANLRASIDTAQAVGAATVLTVPGVINDKQPYQQTYDIALKSLREGAAYAQERGIILGVENVWNRFLLTPKEMAEFISAANSPNVGLYFDCGNILNYGYPQSWIRELGRLIRKVHVKDFDSSTRQFRHLLQGSVNWPEVRSALKEVGYDGYLTAELPLYPTYPDQMVLDTSHHLDRIIAGA
jgi:L-ribulose-5-phosphate 3-epimerase